ncbi:MAG TPA: tripartite tricarboxylate transporter TctB family protein [Burkholderiales bacterium]
MHSDSSDGEGRASTPRSDFIASMVWIVFGVVVAIASWNMDRLKSQDINPYTIPGLVPGLLGAGVVIFGLLMMYRAWRQGALTPQGDAGRRMAQPGEWQRFLLVLAPCLIFGGGLLGHGLPFWAAAALFVTATVFILQYRERKAAGQLLRGFVVAAVIGLAAGGLITYVFQELFLVRLP